MYTLYGSQGSGSAIAEAALERCGIGFRSVRASAWEADSAIDELKKVNPLGQIPTLVLPDGSVMTESAAILIHLGLMHPASGLLPASTSARAQTFRGLVFIAANCYAAISVSDYPERWTTATSKASHGKVRAAARTQLHRSWGLFFDTFSADLARDADQPGAPLRLDGEGITLTRVLVNGASISFRIDAGQLVLGHQQPHRVHLHDDFHQ